MENRNLTVWQRLTQAFGPNALLNQDYPTYSFDRKELCYCLRQYLGEITILLCIILIYAFYTRNAYFSSWDDFSFWGGASKELLLSNVFKDMFTSIIPLHAQLPTWTGSISLLYATIFGIF